MNNLSINHVPQIKLNLLFEKRIAYTYSWRKTLTVAAILVFFTCSILLLLQPFDTYRYEAAFKELLLSGYSICIIFPILAVHEIENRWYKKSNAQWMIWQEFLIICLIASSTIMCAYLYNTIVINRTNPEWSNGLKWALYFGMPFLPTCIPLLVYFRFTFGQLKVQEQQETPQSEITLKGETQGEVLLLNYQEFILAQAQQNYVRVFYWQNGNVKTTILRSSLTRLSNQIPGAQQVHRSFLINIQFIEAIKGNARQRTIKISGIDFEIPVSKSYHETLLKHSQIQT
jgi:hypothetical protein